MSGDRRLPRHAAPARPYRPAARRQGGWSLLSLTVVLALVVLFAKVAWALYPGYYESAVVRKALESLGEDKAIAQLGKPALWSLIEKRLDMSGLNHPTPTERDLRVDYDPTTGQKRIVLEYDYRAPLFNDLSLLLHVRHQLQVQGTPSARD